MMCGLPVLALLGAVFQSIGEPLWLAPEPATVTAINTRTVTLPKGTEVSIRIDATLGSKLSKPGDIFDISLATPIVVEGVELVPAGAKGQGQVVHAAKATFGGGAGELILAARFLDHSDQRIALRRFRFGRTGNDNTAEAMAVNAALGPLGLLVSGGNVTVEPGTVATARTAADTELESSTPQEGLAGLQQED